MKITIIVVGKLKERFWREACAEYLKRLSAFAQVSVKELPDIDPGRAGGEKAARAKESASIIAALPSGAYAVLLASDGMMRTSEQWASRLDRLCLDGTSEFAFIIGGSTGVDKSVYDRVDDIVSFGPITLPHNLARVVLLEQLYRAFKISRGEPYHK